jgi:cytochrome c oxidase subunit 2
MIGRIVVMEPADYQAWLGQAGTVAVAGGPPAGGAPPGEPASAAPAAAGEALFTQKGCAACHQAQGGALGPSLVGIFGTKVKLQDGSEVLVDGNYLRESILNPTAKIVAGFQPVMPTFQGQLTEEQVLDLIQYIKSLTPAGAPAGQGVAAAPAGGGPAS